MKTGSVALAFSLLLGIAGCAEEAEPDDDTVDGDRTAQLNQGWGCRDCGYLNSPILGVHDLGAFRTGNTAGDGLLLLDIMDPNGATYPVQIVGDAFVATKNNQNYSGSQLLHWQLRFQTPAKDIIEVEIYNYQTHADWTPSGKLVDTYTLVYEDVSGDFDVNVCPGLDLDITSVALIPGETYDLESITVEPGATGWVTVACRGHALAKMKMLGYDPSDTYGSKWEQRQATLKMLTADYCGTGDSFTQVGQPVDWRDAKKHFPIDGTEDKSKLEAKWTLDGATCLTKPRLVPIADVEKVCKRPKCPANLDFGSNDWISFWR
jgi:hypothetical protein